MDSREEISYFENLQEVQKTFSENIKELFKSQISCYKGWKRYPRKIKKNLKKTFWWNLKNCDINNIEIIMR